MLVHRKCSWDGKVRTRDIDVTEEQLERHRRGELAQDVFEHLTPDEREFIMTGITREMWDNLIERKRHERDD